MIAIKGIRLEKLGLSIDSDGKEFISGSYSLISSVDKVLAKQDFNGSYGSNSLTIAWSMDTMKAMNELLASAKRDIQSLLGLNEEEEKKDGGH